jgi:hypothetical protein
MTFKIGDRVRIKRDNTNRLTDFYADLDAELGDGSLTRRTHDVLRAAIENGNAWIVKAYPAKHEIELGLEGTSLEAPFVFGETDLELAPELAPAKPKPAAPAKWLPPRPKPRNVKAILDWTLKYRPDCHREMLDIFGGDTDHHQAMQLVASIGFEAGRMFQDLHRWPLENAALYDPANPEPDVPTQYEQLFASLNDLPTTWIPALLALMVQEAERKHVFTETGLVDFVTRARDKAREEKKK